MKIFLLSAFLMFSLGACIAQSKLIPFNNSDINYEGRILFRPNSAELSWPGTSVSINFEGESISALMQDLDTANYYNVLIDDILIKKIHTDTAKKSYTLASGLPAGKHKVQLFKRTEWDKGKTLFYGFETSVDSKILKASVPKKRTMEFYGNSITCGYAMEDTSGNDSWFGYFENGYLSYAAITARYFNAQFNSISKSGIGIMLSWFPLTMPEMYDRLDPLDSSSKWDFRKYTPDIVVINLFQNDSWLVKMHENEQFREKFGSKEPTKNYIIEAYKNFVITVRAKYPKAQIVCALGNMDATREGSPWPGYIQEAIDQMNDPKLFTHFFAYKNTPGHPKVAEQQAMANSLIKFIEKNIKW